MVIILVIIVFIINITSSISVKLLILMTKVVITLKSYHNDDTLHVQHD